MNLTESDRDGEENVDLGDVTEKAIAWFGHLRRCRGLREERKTILKTIWHILNKRAPEQEGRLRVGKKFYF
jgi:hypothetical protein